MPILTDWYNGDKTIIRSIHKGTWTLNDYYENVVLLETMRQSVSHPIAIFLDFSESKTLPSNMLSAGQQAERVYSEQIVSTYIFGLDMYHRIIGNMFMKLFPKVGNRMVLANSLEEALEKAQVKLKQTT